jgi:hypothetical protein
MREVIKETVEQLPNLTSVTVLGKTPHEVVVEGGGALNSGWYSGDLINQTVNVAHPVLACMGWIELEQAFTLLRELSIVASKILGVPYREISRDEIHRYLSFCNSDAKTRSALTTFLSELGDAMEEIEDVVADSDDLMEALDRLFDDPLGLRQQDVNGMINSLRAAVEYEQLSTLAEYKCDKCNARRITRYNAQHGGNCRGNYRLRSNGIGGLYDPCYRGHCTGKDKQENQCLGTGRLNSHCGRCQEIGKHNCMTLLRAPKGFTSKRYKDERENQSWLIHKRNGKGVVTHFNGLRAAVKDAYGEAKKAIAARGLAETQDLDKVPFDLVPEWARRDRNWGKNVEGSLRAFKGRDGFDAMMKDELDPRGPLGDMSGSVTVNKYKYCCVPIHFCEEIREEESEDEANSEEEMQE